MHRRGPAQPSVIVVVASGDPDEGMTTVAVQEGKQSGDGCTVVATQLSESVQVFVTVAVFVWLLRLSSGSGTPGMAE